MKRKVVYLPDLARERSLATGIPYEQCLAELREVLEQQAIEDELYDK